MHKQAHFHILIIILALQLNPLFAQDINYAKKVIGTLASPDYYGRGYVKKGDLKAAKFIKNELQDFGINAFNDQFFQYFDFPVNTFPRKISIKVDNVVLIPGQDYLISANSGSLKGDFKLRYIQSDFLDTLQENKSKMPYTNDVIFFNADNQNLPISESITANLYGAKAIVQLTGDKLVHRISQYQNNFPVIYIKKEKMDSLSKKITITIKNKYYNQYISQNVIGHIEGLTDSLIVYTAHYDHLGMMGRKACFYGANDNASGVSIVLDLARHFSSQKQKPKYTLAFIFFGAEEVGLLGSKYFTEYPLFPLEKIKYLINLDLVGTGDEGIMLVNGSVFPDDYQKFVSINAENNYLAKISARGKAANSDHYYFSENGVKAFFIYTMGGTAEYHNIYDIAENLPLTKYEQLFNLLIEYQKSYE